MAEPAAGDYDAYADQYAAAVAQREQGGATGRPDALLPPLLGQLGDIAGQRVLDAGCGEGYLTRVLAARGAVTTGIDVAPRLIERARRKDPTGQIDYRVADLSRPLPELAGQFDAAVSYLVLNDVRDFTGFAATLVSSLRPGGRLVHVLNNPYTAICNGHGTDYFDSGAPSPYRGLWTIGIKTYYYQRTLEDYLDAFLAAGLRLTKLADLPAHADEHPPHTCLPPGTRLPRFLLLAFTLP
jgi:SAM-dependent methyltransferase